MKLASYRRPDGRSSWGVITGAGIVDIGGDGISLRQALAAPERISPGGRDADFSLDDVELLPPIPDPDKILCLGLNYATHIRESGREPPAKPMIFTRFPSSQVGHGRPLVRPQASIQFDFEGELAVVIGRACRHVPRASAVDVVAGYSCYNDGSIRDWQRHSAQFTPGKNFPATGSFGPWIVTPDELPDPKTSLLTTRLNGVETQRARIDDLVFDIPAIIEYCSTFTELLPGDVLVTGTTGGVGAYRTPPLWMKEGDVLEVEIEGIGTLRNPVIDE